MAARTVLDPNDRPFSGDEPAIAAALVAVGAAPDPDAKADRIAPPAVPLRGG